MYNMDMQDIQVPTIFLEEFGKVSLELALAKKTIQQLQEKLQTLENQNANNDNN